MIKIIAGKYNRLSLSVPNGIKVRPTEIRKKESLFNIITSYYIKQNKDVFKNKIILDAFAGSGSLGIESLSRGANFCYFFEKDKEVFENLVRNCKKIKEKNTYNISLIDFNKIIENKKFFKKKIDIIFFDPPYNMIIDNKLLYFFYSENILSDDPLIIIETGYNNIFSCPNFLKFYKIKNFKKTIIRFLTLK
tara:strand:- start:332 stop:907 length:576 start_codon:yes stop_codon:yes gene_type:complete